MASLPDDAPVESPAEVDDDWTPSDPEALYRQLMAQDPTSTLPRFSLARLCVETGRPDEAVALLRFCVDRQADWAAAWLLLGDALAATSAVDDARAAYIRCQQVATSQNHATLAEEAEEKAAAL